MLALSVVTEGQALKQFHEEESDDERSRQSEGG
jgi:hypothetical protein